MYKDSILEEIWRIKDEFAAQYGYDIRAMGKALMEKQKASGQRVVSFSPKEAQPPPAPPADK